MDGIQLSLIVALLAAGVRLATPLIYASLGNILSERAGVLNIGLEGMMVAGVFGAYLGALVSMTPWGGAFGGMLAGAVIGFLYAVMVVHFRADQVVIGTGINIFITGLTSFFFRAMYHAGVSRNMASFDIWPVPVLSEIPVIGDIFFNHIPLVYIAFLMIPLISYALFHTTAGLKLRAVGEHPRAAETAGINVTRVRYIAVTLMGAMAGLGGAFLSVGELSSYTEGLVAGRGFIALAAVIFGRWNPFWTTMACFLFGLADALQIRLQGMGVPISYEFLLMFPYLLSLITFVIFVNRAKSPAALGKPYPEENR